MMTIALLVGIIMLIIGLMLLGLPDELYKFNQYIINMIYKINGYFNKKLFEFNSYINNLVVSKNSVLTYRLVIAGFYIIIGIGLIYSYTYYSQQGVLPPMLQSFFIKLSSYF